MIIHHYSADVNNNAMIESLDITKHNIHNNYQAILDSFNRNIIKHYENIAKTDYDIAFNTNKKSIYYKMCEKISFQTQ